MHNHVDVGGYKSSFETFFFQNDSMPLFDVSDSDWCQKMPQYQLLLSYLLKCVGGNQSPVRMRIKTGEEGGAGHDATRQQASKQISDYSDADMISWFLHH